MSRDSVRASVAQAFQHARPSGTGWHRANCPECLGRTGKPDHKQALAVNARSGHFKCWKCGVKGRLPGFEDWDPPERATSVPQIPAPEGFALLAGDASMSLEPARAYLRSRVPEELWWVAQIGACASGPYAGRVVVPILADDDKTWVGWVGRTWYKSDRAYTYPKGMNREAVLYNPTALVEPTDAPLLVVEGVMDALHLWPDAVALLGKASESQMEQLEATQRPVVVVLDGDAWTEGYAMSTRLRMRGRRAGYVRLPPTKDPDEVPRDWLNEEIKRAI